MIDIIIPCYNSHKTIDRCIGSILMQRVLPSIHVTLVNDAGKPYDDIIERYSPIMDIKQISYEENGGPAKARNFGLDNTNHKLVMFIDSDDALASPFAVATLCNEMFTDNNVVVSGAFMEEVAPMRFKEHKDDTSFMHGKMYLRAFLDKYNIRQNEKTKCNEDVGFNILSHLIANHVGLKFKQINLLTYYWLQNPNSIVRNDKINFDHGASYQGFADNLTYVYEELEKRGIDSLAILAEKITSMQRLYLMFQEKTNGFPQFADENLKHLKNFYDVVYSKIEHLVTDKVENSIKTQLTFTDKAPYSKEAYRKFLKNLRK